MSCVCTGVVQAIVQQNEATWRRVDLTMAAQKTAGNLLRLAFKLGVEVTKLCTNTTLGNFQ